MKPNVALISIFAHFLLVSELYQKNSYGIKSISLFIRAVAVWFSQKNLNSHGTMWMLNLSISSCWVTIHAQSPISTQAHINAIHSLSKPAAAYSYDPAPVCTLTLKYVKFSRWDVDITCRISSIAWDEHEAKRSLPTPSTILSICKTQEIPYQFIKCTLHLNIINTHPPSCNSIGLFFFSVTSFKYGICCYH